MLLNVGRTTPLLLFLLLAPLLSEAQSDTTGQEEETVDVLHLKDGSILKGRVLGYDRDTVRMELSAGQVLKFPRSEVDRIELDVVEGSEEEKPDEGSTERESGREEEEREDDEEKEGTESPPSEEDSTDYYQPSRETEEDRDTSKELEWGTPYHRKGYQHHLSSAWFINVGDTPANLSFLLNPQAYSFHTYRFSPYMAAGIYAGLQVLGQKNYGPLNSLGLNFNGDVLQNSWLTPYWDIQTGFSHSFPSNNMTQGFFGNFGIGAKVFFNSSKGMSVLLAYQLYNLKQEINNRWRQPFTREDRIRGLSVRITMHL